jgi:hypothetical protein
LKKGSKVTPYKDDIVFTDLSSMIKRNSHDYSEIKLDASKIFFSGSEDSPEKMDVITTTFAVELNYDTIFKDAYLGC